MTENKKIRNAKATVYDGIEFKSKLERDVYVMLHEEGFDAKYESRKFVLKEGFKPTRPYYTSPKSNGKIMRSKLESDCKKIQSIVYTPDFVFEHNGFTVIVEVKGQENDSFPRTKKLFRSLMEESDENMVYFVIYSKSSANSMIEILKTTDFNEIAKRTKP